MPLYSNEHLKIQNLAKSSYERETRISLSGDFEVVSIVIYASLTRTKNQKISGGRKGYMLLIVCRLILDKC